MEVNFSTPQRMLHGVGTGVENSGLTHPTGGTTDGKIEKSPYHRVPLSAVSENRSALLSGVQRIPVKPKAHEVTPVQSMRSPNNFMKPTESSRVNGSTPVRAQSFRSTPISNTPSYAQPIHASAVDSANIYHFVSPSAHSAPLATPTRPQSAGRAMSAPRRSPGHQLTSSPKRVTPQDKQDRFERSDRPERQESSQVNSTQSGRKLTPSVVVGSAKKSREAREGRESESVTPKGTNTGATAYAYDHLGTTASQMLFSPDAAQRQAHRQHRQSPARVHIVAASPGSAGKMAGSSVAGRPASAPRLRPQSLSAQLAAHSERAEPSRSLFSESRLQSAGPSTGPAGSVLSPTPESQGTTRRSPGTKTSPTDTAAMPAGAAAAPVVTSPVPHPNLGKVKPPTHNAPVSAVHSHIPKAAPGRSADVLSANKAAKKAALALQAQPHPISSGHNTGVARYLQPTHSSAAATTAVLTQPTTHAANKAQKTRIPAYARPTLNSAGIAAPADEVPTPSRASKLAKRTPATNAYPTAKNNINNNVVSGGLRRKESLEKLPATSPTNPTNNAAKSNKNLKTSPSIGIKPKNSAGKLESAQNTSNNGTLNVSTIMQMLEGNNVTQKMNNNDSNMQGKRLMRRSYSFGSELSCVVGVEEEGSLGGSIDLSGHDSFGSDQMNLSQRVPTPSPVHTLQAMHSEFENTATATSTATATPSANVSATVGVDNNSSATSNVMQDTSGVNSLVKKAIVTRMRNTTTTNTTNTTVPVTITAPTTTAITATSTATAIGARSPLRLQVPEDGLANLSIVDAPATFSPINISMLSNFSQNDFISVTETIDVTNTTLNAVTTNTEFVPIQTTNATSLSQRLFRSVHTTDATTYNNSAHNITNATSHPTVSPTHHTPAELSYIHHVNSMNNLSYTASHSSINYTVNTATSAKKKNEAWTEDYSALFPPDSALSEDVMGTPSNLNDSYSTSQINIVNALNYTGVEVSQNDSNSNNVSDNISNNVSNNASNTSIAPLDYATSPRVYTLNRQHHSVNNNNVHGVRTVAQSTFDPVASASDALNTAMLRSTNTINTMNTTTTAHNSTVRTMDSDVLNRGMLNTNNASLSNSTYSLGPAVLMTGHPQLVRNISDNMSTQSFNLSAIAPVTNMTSSFDMEQMEHNMENVDGFNSNLLFSRSSSRMNNLSRGAMGASADSNITNNTHNTHNTYNTVNTTNVLDRAMIASYDNDEVLSEIRLCRNFGSGVSDSTMSVSPFLLAHPGFERSASDYNTNNVITPVATSVSGIGLRTTFFPPPAPVDAMHSVHASDAINAATANNTNTNMEASTFYPVSESHEFNNSMDKFFGTTQNHSTIHDTNYSGPDSHTNPLNDFSVNHSADHSILHSVLNSVEWNVQQSLESLPPPPPPMEPYPNHPLYNNNLALDTSGISGGDALLTVSSNHTGRFDSENDSVLHDTCDFERIESSTSDPCSGNNSSGTNSGDNSGDNSSNLDSDNIVSASPVSEAMDHGRDTSSHSEHNVNTTNTDSSHSASIHPTALDTSVDLTASNSNVHLRTFHLPAPVINTTQNVQSYLDFENDEPIAVTERAVSPLPPVLSPDSAMLKQQLLQESMRQFSAMHTLTGDNSYPYNAYETEGITTSVPVVSGMGNTGSIDYNIRGSFGMASLARLPSIGSMRSLSYIVSSTEGTPRYLDCEERSVEGERVEDGSVGEGYSDSEEKLEGIQESYDDYKHVHMGGNGDTNVDISLQSGVSHLTHSVNESVNHSVNDSISGAMSMGVNESVSLSVAQSVGGYSVGGNSVGNSMTSNTYTSSVEELRQCNPKLKTASWVKGQYPEEMGNPINTLHVHSTPQKGTTMRICAQQASTEADVPLKTPVGRFRTIPHNFASPSGGNNGTEGTLVHSTHVHKDASYFTNGSMVPVPPRPSVIVREEVNIDEHIGMYYGEQSNPDPLARQLLLMDEPMKESKMQNGKYRGGIQHVFLPVNELVNSMEF